MVLTLTDIRCGCGGLCDSGEPCPMRRNVQACDCRSTRIIHTIGQPWCLHALICRMCGKPSINPLRDGRCIVCELLQVKP